MAAATTAQETRSTEFAGDLYALVHTDYLITTFTQWFDDYIKYVKFGPEDEEKGADRPPHKPPTP